MLYVNVMLHIFMAISVLDYLTGVDFHDKVGRREIETLVFGDVVSYKEERVRVDISC